MDNEQLSIQATFDKVFISEGGQSTRFLVIEVTAPKKSRQAQAKPLNLAIVIDVSDSMTGKPLDAAKKAAIGVIKLLKETDTVSVVSFADDVRVHCEGKQLNARNKKDCIQAIEKLHVRGNTNLCDGWLVGADCVAKIMEGNADMQNHVIVLSDGYANLGITDPKEIRHHALNLRTRGVLTSAVGIGDGYSPAQLEALAEYGGGRIHDAQHPGEIIEVVLGQLRELSNTVMDDVIVKIEFPPVNSIRNVSGFPSKFSDTRVTTFFGSFVSEAQRTCVYRITTPEGMHNDQLDVKISTSYRPVGSNKAVAGASTNAVLTFTDSESNKKQLRNLPISALVARTWQAAVVRHVVELNRLLKFDEASKYLDRHLERFITYCDGLPETSALVKELVHMRSVAHTRWDERSRKEMQLASYQSTYNQLDSRSVQRQGWSTFLPPFQDGK